MRATEKKKKKTGRPSFPVPHRTMNVYLPNDLHDRLAVQAQHAGMSRSHLIRTYIATCLDDAEINAIIGAKQAKVLR